LTEDIYLNNEEDIEQNHTEFDCRDCLLFTKNEQCRAFEDHLDPITDEQGYCSAKIVDINTYVALAKDTGLPFDIHSTKDCENCLLNVEGECKIYDNKEKPLLNDNGKCLGRIITNLDLRKLVIATKWEYFRKKLNMKPSLFD
jgi:hypothetical protein